ncbi:hypothetical protein [Nocardioides aquiterrae]|uniref:Glycosyltransferase RgtA/B/C/D-like domain-containing protein n=1 Tax=Nocardioides aquiterrae TaxID=203799 RepID=A0ABP4F272_9ACTN
MSAGRSTRVTTATDCLTVGVVALVVFALHGFDGPLDRDLGVFTYGGEHVAHGVPPYAGIFNSVGPLSDALPGLAIWAGAHLGIGPVSAERHLFVVLAAGCCVALFLLARDVLGSRGAGFAAAAVLLTFQDFSALASDGPREKTAMVLLMLATLLLLTRRRWAAAGVTTALATLTWQPVLVVAVAAAVAAATGARGGRVRAGLAFVGGGVATTALFAAWFALRGDLQTAVEGFVVVNAEYTRQPSLLTQPGVTWTFLWRSYHASVLLVPLGLVALVGLAARARRQDPPLLVCGAAGLAATVWTVAVINGPPDLFVLLPFAALGVAAVVTAGARRLTEPLGRVVVASVTLAAVLAATAVAVGTRSDGLERERADVRAVLAAAPTGATLLSINAPEVLALAGRTNPTPYQVFDEPMDRYLQASWPGGLSGYAHWIARARPTLVAFAAGRHQRWPDRVLRRDYWLAGRGPAWRWYVARTAGVGTFAAVSRAIRVARHVPA